jgi:hypothetical protein
MDARGKKQMIENVGSAKQKQYQTYMSMLSQTGLFISINWNVTLKLYHTTFK